MAKTPRSQPKQRRSRSVASPENEAAAQAVLSLLHRAHELRASLAGTDIDPSEELLAKLAKNILPESGEARRHHFSLEDKAAILRAHLDLVEQELRASPDLRAEFEQHVVMQNYLRIPRRVPDTVAEEIAHEVKIRWADRKRPRYKDRPWFGLTRPELFVSDVYQKWYSRGILKLKHLGHDPKLKAAYREAIKLHPDRDLQLPVGRSQDLSPAEIRSIGRVSGRLPASALSENELKQRRAVEAQRKRAYRAAKKGRTPV
jgi:hypothetical protein